LAFFAAFFFAGAFFTAFFFAAMCYLPDSWSTTNDALQRRMQISERGSTLQGRGRSFLRARSDDRRRYTRSDRAVPSAFRASPDASAIARRVRSVNVALE
jgi:hypothetical protein